MHGSLQVLLHQYGYFGVFFVFVTEMIGAPFPAETTLTFCGIEWSQGNFSFLPLWLTAAFGNIVGSTLSYTLGRYFGYTVVTRYGHYVGLTAARFNKVQQKFNQHENSIVLYGKFISGIRVLTPFLAGANRMGFTWFSFWNGLSALGWSAFFIFEGRYLGQLWTRYGKYHEMTLILVASTIVSLIWVRFMRRRRLMHRIK